MEQNQLARDDLTEVPCFLLVNVINLKKIQLKFYLKIVCGITALKLKMVLLNIKAG